MVDYQRLLEALASKNVEFVIVGGLAATLHGSARLTADLEVVYNRSKENIARLVEALSPLKLYMRGAPNGSPFRFDAETVKHGLNFTLTTDAGPLDLLGEIAGVGNYARAIHRSVEVDLFGTTYRCLDLDTLIAAKRAAGRRKDLEVIGELEIIRDENRKKP